MTIRHILVEIKDKFGKIKRRDEGNKLKKME